MLRRGNQAGNCCLKLPDVVSGPCFITRGHHSFELSADLVAPQSSEQPCQDPRSDGPAAGLLVRDGRSVFFRLLLWCISSSSFNNLSLSRGLLSLMTSSTVLGRFLWGVKSAGHGGGVRPRNILTSSLRMSSADSRGLSCSFWWFWMR